MDNIVEFINSLGVVLEYYPKDVDSRECWSYDDGEPCGLYIVVYTGINGLGLPGCWVEISNYLREDNTYEFSCTLEDWMEYMSEPFKARFVLLR